MSVNCVSRNISVVKEMDESVPETTTTTKYRSAHDTRDDADGLGRITKSDHAFQKDEFETSQLSSEGNILNKPMYSTEDWEVLYELRSLDGRQQNICCLKAYALYCVYSIRLKMSKQKPLKIGDPNIFVIPVIPHDKPLSDNKTLSVTDVRLDVPTSPTDIFDSRTGTIEKKRVFTFMSTVMNVPGDDHVTDLQAKDNTVSNEKQVNLGETKAVGSKEFVPSKDIESRSEAPAGSSQREKKQGRFLKMLRWFRRK